MTRRTVLLARLGLAGGALGAWELAAGDLIPGVRFGDPFFISSPSRIATDLVRGFAGGRLAGDVAVTLFEALAGLVLGLLTGVALGLAFGMFRPLGQVLDPFMTALNALPRAALAPLAVLCLGIGIASKILVAWSLVFFLVFYNTYLGVLSIDGDLLDAIRVMGATRMQLGRIVILPSVFTWILAAFRLSVSYALVGAIIGEFVGATAGLGYRLIAAEGLLQTDRLYATLVLVGVVAAALTAGARVIEDRLLSWRPPVRM